jgi:ribosomal protein S18 acetylase RimI-like enzyme
MRQSAFRVDACGSSEGDGEDLASHASRHAGAFYYAKIPVSDVATVAELEGAGLAVVDVQVTLISTGAVLPLPSPDVSVDPVDSSTAFSVLNIAESCFRYSRFHLDPLVNRETANRIKRAWIESYINGHRGEVLLVAAIAGRPAGFLAVLASNFNNQCVYHIDLVGVAPQFQRRGVGRALVRAFMLYAAGRAERLQVGTQIANTPSLRLYQRCGFGIGSAAYVLHGHTVSNGFR